MRRGAPRRPGHAAQPPAPAPHRHSGHGHGHPRGRGSPRAASWAGPLPPCSSPAALPGPAGSAALCSVGLAGVGACSGPSGGVGPFQASCSGSFPGGRPHSLLQSVVFRAFSPRSPCFRLGKVRETLSFVVTSEPFGLNSKCGRPRPWGAGVGGHHVGTLGAWGTARAACWRRLRWVDVGGSVGEKTELSASPVAWRA